MKLNTGYRIQRTQRRYSYINEVGSYSLLIRVARTTTALHVSLPICSNMKCVSSLNASFTAPERILYILEPLAGSCYGESRFSAAMAGYGNNISDGLAPAHLRNHRVSCITQWAFAGHGLSDLLWLQICKYAKRPSRQGPRAGSAGQRAEPQGQLPSTPLSFIASQSQSHSPRSMHTRRVTNRSPSSALRCHHTVREQQIRYGTGWWLGCLTISGLGTLRRLFPRPPKKYGGYVLDKNPEGLVQIDCSLAVSGSKSSFPFFEGRFALRRFGQSS